MRPVRALLTGAVTAGVLAVSAVSAVAVAAGASGTTTTTDPLYAVKGLELASCPQGFSVSLTDRGGRLITTVYEGRDVVRQTITGSSVVELRTDDGRLLELTLRERAVYVRNADGTTTLTQQGSSGLVIDPGDPTADPPQPGSIIWYTGRGTTTGVLNEGGPVPTFATVTEQTVTGLQGDVCDMLVQGLKTRH